MDAIKRAHGAAVETETRLGSGGVFDVSIDGEVVFRKKDAGRFPTIEEVLAAIAGRLRKG